MEKRDQVVVAVAILLLAGVAMYFEYGGLGITGNVISDSNNDNECNILDFNFDGKVDQEDKVKFNRDYEANYQKEYYCGKADLNDDNKLNVVDSNRFAELFQKNYGSYGSSCKVVKKPCEGVDDSEVVSTDNKDNSLSEVESDVESSVSEEKPVINETPKKLTFFGKIANFFKNIF
ncbi:MAG: hypothetical protein WC867_04625 [Candidatus Pacearchaeota archaeon]|jgi:hypothetical protein